MKKIIILILLLVSVIGCIEQKAEQPLSTPTPQITEVTSTTTIATTDNRTLQANDTIPEINTIPVVNSTSRTNGTVSKTVTALTSNSDNSVPTQSVTSNDTEDNSTEDASLDAETEYGDNNEPPDEEPECYDANGVDTPCPPDMV